MMFRMVRAWRAFKERPLDDHRWNKQHNVFTDQSREWFDIKTAPRGVKLHLLTREGMPTHGYVNDSTICQFKGWEPLPSTPQWMKQRR